ncbi:hypothetical protein ASC95_04840 [Pelomonas sp. Root1217]|nr:hypothetical protein ASC95_04840 [Pelomonas sp. Root1217]
MEVFWCQGFEATGMPDLVEAMGIGRQSLYNAFESKRGLFLEALRLYQAERAQSLQKVLASAPSPLAGIETLLTSIASSSGVARTRGCMSVNTAAEIGTNDEEVAAILREGAKRSKTDVAAALAQAKTQDELPPTLDETAAADFVLTIMRGLRLSAKAGASVTETRNVVHLALVALRHFQADE